MSLADIDGALVQAYQDMNLGLPTAAENVPFDPPADGSDWAAHFQLPAPITEASLTEIGQDEHTGIFQIDFNVKKDTGRAQLLTYCQAVRDQFVAGKTFTRNTQVVRVGSTDRSQFRIVDGWMRASVSVNWIARTTRPGV